MKKIKELLNKYFQIETENGNKGLAIYIGLNRVGFAVLIWKWTIAIGKID